MVLTRMPNSALMKGKFKRASIQSLSSVSLSASASAQTEVDIPTYGDLIGIGVVLTGLATGTLSTPGTIEKAIQEISIKDVHGRAIMSKIRGQDLPMICRLLNAGQNRTVPTVSGSAQTHRFLLPINVEKKHMTAKVQVTLAPYSDLASSGATGATVSLDLVAYYADESNMQTTTRLSRISQTIASGEKRFAPDLPKGVVIEHLMFSVGTESNITSIDFSADGVNELSGIRPTDLQTIEDEVLIDGHVTGQFSLYNAPFVATDKTILDISGAGSDTINWILVLAD